MVSMKACQEQKERLGRSLVGKILEPIDFMLLRKELIREGSYVTEVSDLGAYKALVTFESQESAKEAVFKEWEVLKNTS